MTLIAVFFAIFAALGIGGVVVERRAQTDQARNRVRIFGLVALIVMLAVIAANGIRLHDIPLAVVAGLVAIGFAVFEWRRAHRRRVGSGHNFQ